MDSAVPLSYAPRQRRTALRRIAKAILLSVAVIAVALAIRDGRRRAAVLENDVQIGPVDWWAVCTSATLFKTAWTLSSNPTAYRDGPFEVTYGDIDATLAGPLEYRDAKVHFDLVVTNRGSEPMILPPVRVVGIFPPHESCHGVPALVEPASVLGNGVRVIAPGGHATLRLAVPGNREPSNAELTVRLCGQHFQFKIHGGDKQSGSRWYPQWSEIPQDEIERLPVNRVAYTHPPVYVTTCK